MVRETTAVDASSARELGQFIHSRTKGNPFAVKTFLRFLHEKGMLRFQEHSGQWGWVLAHLEASEIPDDVADLMAAEIQQLPDETGALLQVAACLGSTFGFRELTVVRGTSITETARAIWMAIERGLVQPLSRDFLLLDPQTAHPPMDLEVPLRFLHDKVRHTAYSLIPQKERAEFHMRIGLRLLEDARYQGTREERLFSILPHLGHAPHLIDSLPLRLELAGLYLKGGRRAKTSGAYRTAYEFFRTGSILLPPEALETEHELAFALQMELAETSYLSGEFEVAQSLFSGLLARAQTSTQRAGIHSMQVLLRALSGQYDMSVQMGLEGLRLLGINLPEDPNQSIVEAELRALRGQLGGRRLADLLKIPQTRDPRIEMAVSILALAQTPAYHCNQMLFALLVLRGVRLSLEYGNSRLSPFCYVTYGVFLIDIHDDPNTAWEFGQLATELASRLQDPMMLSRIRYVRAGFINLWSRSVQGEDEALRGAKAHGVALSVKVRIEISESS